MTEITLMPVAKFATRCLKTSSSVNEFGVSAATEAKRRPVFLGILLLIVTFAILLCWTAFEISSMDRQYFSMLEIIRNFSSWGADKLKSSGISPEFVAKVSATDVDRTHRC